VSVGIPDGRCFKGGNLPSPSETLREPVRHFDGTETDTAEWTHRNALPPQRTASPMPNSQLLRFLLAIYRDRFERLERVDVHASGTIQLIVISNKYETLDGTISTNNFIKRCARRRIHFSSL
jgi:hypothetical protein